jgi:hypothetical protein
MRSAEEFNNVQRLVAGGMNDCAIARQTGIPRPTVRDWRCKSGIRPRNRAGSSLYLGDGCISRNPRTFSLRVSLDSKYPAIIERCRQAIDLLMPTQRAGLLRRSDGCTDVYLCSKHWPCLFPQHGPDKKHTRRIALERWQQALVDRATEEFILGLIHSDGCRVVANDRGVTSIRYHFSNRSEDILGLFTAALDALGIPWTRSTKYSDKFTVSAYRKAATARLDEFVGPKDRAVPLDGVHYTA